MQESIFSGLSIVIVIATGMALLMRLIKQPLIIGHILTGILVGPTVFHLLKSPTTIQTFSNIGIALLLFIIGLGLNLKVIKEIGRIAALVGLIQVGLIAVLGWLVGNAFGLSYRQSVFLGVALSFSSTIIILKLLNDKKETSRLYGKITIGVLIIQDVLAAIALLFVTSQGNNSSISLDQLGSLAAKGLLATAALFIVGNLVLPRMQKLISTNSEFLFLFAIGWGFGSAALFEGIGFSLEIGALLGGIALASLPFVQEISARLRPLRDFFIVVFFISLGSRLTFSSLGSQLGLILVAGLIVVVIKPLVVLLVMSALGYTKQTSFKTAISLGQISEFSLVLILLGNSIGIIPASLVNVVTILALGSIAISTYAINYSDPLFRLLERQLAFLERAKAKTTHEARRHHYELVLLGYKQGGQEFLKLFQDLKKDFIVVDYDPEVIEIMEREHVNCIYGDATDVELLEEIGIEHSKLIVSTVPDHDTNVFLIKLLEKINPSAIVIVHAETIKLATELYALGASYVVIPHYIGNEKIGAFIKNSSLKKSEFDKYQQKHLAYLQTHYALASET
ncbi:MAG TPA: cation:proton antiporter family protein [Candidatus Saccharimonadales bacterium]|nr:cation:proton antiporter family protein [Candidatus Saccharimonadales bacterium]